MGPSPAEMEAAEIKILLSGVAKYGSVSMNAQH